MEIHHLLLLLKVIMVELVSPSSSFTRRRRRWWRNCSRSNASGTTCAGMEEQEQTQEFLVQPLNNLWNTGTARDRKIFCRWWFLWKCQPCYSGAGTGGSGGGGNGAGGPSVMLELMELANTGGGGRWWTGAYW